MKRLLIMASAALPLASCGNNEYEAWIASQSNSAKIVSAVTFNISQAAAIDFDTATADSIRLFVPKVISKDSVVPQTPITVLSYNSKTATLSTSKEGKVKSSKLVSAIESPCGRSDDLHQVVVAVTDRVKLLRGGGLSLSQSVTTNVACVAPTFIQYLYMSGDANGWSFNNPLCSAAADDKYTGFMYLNQNSFRFTTKQDWSGTDYGTGLVEKGNNIMMIEPAGFYEVDVNLTSQTLTYTTTGRAGVIGSTTAGGWSSDQAIAYNTTEECWEIKGITLTAGEMKFHANDDWILDWSGPLTDITFKGGNINVATGRYNIKLYLLYGTESHCTMETVP